MSRGLGKMQRAIIALLDNVSAHRTIHELAGSIYGTAETSVATSERAPCRSRGAAVVARAEARDGAVLSAATTGESDALGRA